MATKIQSWFRDPSLILYNKYYEPDEEVSQYMRENSQFLGIFFGAFRNKSTKHFITYLNKFYRYIQQRDEPFDIIYVPLDEDEPECDYFVNACMEEWLVVPWTNQNLRRNVRNLYNVLTQPTLVVVRNDDEGTVVSYDGKTDLLECGYFSLIEWKSVYKKILQDIKAGKIVKKSFAKPADNLPDMSQDVEKPESPPDINSPDKPVGIPSDKPAENPSDKPVGIPSDKAAEAPSDKPAENPSGKPSENLNDKPAENPSDKPAENPSDKPAENASGKPSENLNDKPAENPSDKPAENPSVKPSENLSDKPAENPSDKPAENPSGKPSENLSEKPPGGE